MERMLDSSVELMGSNQCQESQDFFSPDSILWGLRSRMEGTCFTLQSAIHLYLLNNMQGS